MVTGPEQVERLRVTLIDWLSSGLRGPYDAAFSEKRSHIGRRHVQIGLPQQYMFAAINVVRGEYQDLIDAMYSHREAMLTIRSVNKLLDIELALMLRDYQLESEAQLVARERRNRAERLAALQTMTEGLAHEVRNPLNSAALQLELVERRLRRDTDDTSLLDPIGLAAHEIRRLSDMLTRFLAFASASDLHLEQHDAIALARQVIESERERAAKHGVELTLVVSSDAVVAAFDAGKLHQIMLHLVRNAIEAAPTRGHVSLGVAIDGDALRVFVGDDGAGIDVDTRRRIYEPFFSTKEGALGMGLAIVHNFVTMHGGHIDVVTSSKGTAVTVEIPRQNGVE